MNSPTSSAIPKLCAADIAKLEAVKARTQRLLSAASDSKRAPRQCAHADLMREADAIYQSALARSVAAIEARLHDAEGVASPSVLPDLPVPAPLHPPLPSSWMSARSPTLSARPGNGTVANSRLDLTTRRFI